ncbi:MAG TPA: hypothetical protein VIJ75_07665 [Hanamia sp.]
MKRNISTLFLTLFTCIAVVLLFSGCYEGRYYHRYHHHTRNWYERRHTPPPAGVNFELDVRQR